MDEGAIKQYVNEFWLLVEKAGLKEEVFDAASIECIASALYLISAGTPVNTIVSLMNSSADYEQKLLKMERDQRRRDREGRQTINRVIAEQSKAGNLIRSSPQAFAAELHALFLSSEDEEEMASALAEILKIHHFVRQGNFPDLKWEAIARLSNDERLSLLAACQEIVKKEN